MIKVYRAKNESRKRDKKRDRFILQVGSRKTHMTREEACDLLDSLEANLIGY